MKASDLIRLMKKAADAIRTRIKELQNQCDELEKIAVSLEQENGGANNFRGKTISDKVAQKVIDVFNKSKARQKSQN